METTDPTGKGNRLGQEKSPYLLQHAENPVHWRGWGSAALAEAQRLDRPILLSIGYAACHWCHVMAHESFEDRETAALMNALFINIKVDREERPDIDHIYMSALHALGEQGGWPLTMFLTPQGTPFWGGTYFPPEPRWGRPSFQQVLTAVSNAYAAGDKAVSTNAVTLQRALTASAATRPGRPIGPDTLDRVAQSFLGLTDRLHGGLRGAPKFPNPPIFRFLWQTASAPAREAVHTLLIRMSQGGVYDHLGGGYARYSTDAEWLVPHFEKMLYDNAQILELLAFAQADRPCPLYQARATETIGWLTRDMASAGAFAASEDADSEGVEGKFYVWTLREVESVLGPDAARFCAAYDVTESGNWEGHTILRRLAQDLAQDAEETVLARGRAALFQARSARIRPGRDDKILADWNGLMVSALARAAAVFRRPDWLALAGQVFDRILVLLGQPDGRVAHAWRQDQVTASGMLEDQACMARAALSLFEATGDASRLAQAEKIAEAAVDWFGDADGSLFTTARDATDIPAIRPRTAADNAVPNGNGLMAEIFARLYHLTGDAIWRARAASTIQAFSGAADRLAGMPTLLAAAELLEQASLTVVVGNPASTAARRLLTQALSSPDPTMCVLRAANPDALPPGHPAHGKAPPPGHEAAAFICKGNVCGLPMLPDGSPEC
jgi:uncharacterized protein YyaL (SSP411 family)